MDTTAPPPIQESLSTAESMQTVETPLDMDHDDGDSLNVIRRRKKKKKKAYGGVSLMSSSSSPPSTQRSTRLVYKPRNPKVLIPLVRRRGRFAINDMEAAALPLGMSFAAVVAQVLDRTDTSGKDISVDHLPKICASAVRESLANVFGDKFDFFARNFEKSFGSTLRTLRLINQESIDKGAYHLRRLSVDNSDSDLNLNSRVCSASGSGIKDCQSETELPFSVQNQMHVAEVVEESLPSLNQELTLHGQLNQRVSAPGSLGSVINHLSTVEKSLMEQTTRSNDLKALEISLTMKKLKLKEAQLALSFNSNNLERSKLAMGISKQSFKAEKLKNQLEDMRHAELLKNCIDCLVAGLFIMSACLLYGAYVFSYQKISDATASCIPLVEESKSWWIHRSISSVNSGLHTLRCQVQVLSRMLFAILIILAVAYLLIQRSSASGQTMPITFILLLLGGACGIAGKFCVDTLGGSGLQWLLLWETMCLLHFFSNVATSALFHVLYGPITVSQGMKSSTIFPYCYRRTIFYSVVLFFLPMCCGLLPFAGAGEWRDHFLLWIFKSRV